MRAAVYSGTRNLYPHMVTAAKSLVANSSVEKIYFLIEDDAFPEALPPLIETVNVSGQTWFPQDGPNMKSQFTYMALVRACYCRILPEDLDRVLQLDVDTIVTDSIEELWDLEMGRKWYAMAEEKFTTWHPYGINYYNAGVAMINLVELRKAGAEDEMIRLLNTQELPFIDQDAMNKLGYPRKIMEIPTRFNENRLCGYSDRPAIVHYAGFRNCWENPQTPRLEHYRKYRDMTWEEVFACRGETPPAAPARKPTRTRKAKKSAES